MFIRQGSFEVIAGKLDELRQNGLSDDPAPDQRQWTESR